MATLVLGAVGASLGGGLGGTLLGITGAVAGRAAGAMVGQALDQRLLGTGSDAVDAGRIDRFRLTGASEGTAIARVWGRMRMAGQVVWASPFEEHVSTSGGGKGAPRVPRVNQYSYSVSLAVALCEGMITDVGRIWADGVEIERDSVTMRVYPGSEDQLPDSKIEAVEGTGMAPAYRGTAYVVFEDLSLEPFGNRVPQFTFEVMRPAQGVAPELGGIEGTRAVAMIPGTGEYSLATTPVHFSDGLGGNRVANVNSGMGGTDFTASLEQLRRELPQVGSVSLVVSWFGDDLRCGNCQIRPKVEHRLEDGVGMPWEVSGLIRRNAEIVALQDDRPVYGGTPCDRSVIEALTTLREAGQKAVFYPFILMEQLAGNARPDPWGGAEQARLPWRGRITTSKAPGLSGSPDGTSAAAAEVAAFFGTVAASDFQIADGKLVYSGPEQWSYRRFILHYAWLAKLAGGVDAFCIGSEMRGLTSIRGAGNAFPAVAAMRALAADVRAILGPGVKIGYAADWSEYFGHSDGAGNRWFHLDPLWADSNIDFIGIDNYMPLSDWRDGSDHADAHWGSIYDLDYLRANIAGGEGYEWYYASQSDREAQIRTPITDGAGEQWIWRYKDLLGWWQNPHHERIGGVRQATPTAWVPRSKPFWFTEIGCAAIDKGTNEPNKFLDPKSSESSLPAFSSGLRDDLIQMQYLRALYSYWGDVAHNPVSPVYGGQMVDMARAHVWAWDARPFPAFPQALDVWSDGGNYARGHWITGRTSGQPLEAVVAELCEAAGVSDYDVSAVRGYVRGYVLTEVQSARAALQSLMLAHGLTAAERDGTLVFSSRGVGLSATLDAADMVAGGEDGAVRRTRSPDPEVAGRVRLSFVEAEGDYETRSTEVVFPDDAGTSVSQSELPLSLTAGEARQIAERWLSEARVAREGVSFALPPSMAHLGAGDIVALDGGLYRIDRLEIAGEGRVEAVRVEEEVYSPADAPDEPPVPRPIRADAPVLSLFLDLPLLTGDEVEHAPHLAVTASPWPGNVAVYSAAQDNGYTLNGVVNVASTIGKTLTVLPRAEAGLWDRGPVLTVKVRGGALSSADMAAVLSGANAAAIGDGSSDGWEVIQFQQATLVAPDTYDISLRLRGQAGTDRQIRDWPEGSWFVLLNGVPEQIDLSPSARGVARHYRIGPAHRSYDDVSFTHQATAFRGVGLRPYPVVHLRAAKAGGDIAASWVRRTRIDGDGWEAEVPLGEASEAYVLRVIRAGAMVREERVSTPGWIYTAAQRAADGVSGGFVLSVAQISERFGAGPFTEINVDE